MVKVLYRGRLGNNLFQYAMGRILAQELGYGLQATPITGFPSTNRPVSGQCLDIFYTIPNVHKIDLREILKSGRGIIVDGYYQNYSYYQPYKEKIHTWLRSPVRSDLIKGINQDDVVAHIRRTDSQDTVMAYDFAEGSNKASGDITSFEWYDNILKKLSFNRLHICTNVPDDPFLRHFRKYDPIIRSSHVIDDFNYIKSFKTILSSISTFCWWASFLSDAERIFFPVPNYGTWADVENVDLRVTDEPRYVMVPAFRKAQTMF